MRRWTVLLLSDNVESLRLWQASMADRGANVVMADFTRRRAEEYLVEPPDLVVLDAHRALPDALSLCRSLRAQVESPILMVAYFAGELDMLDAYGIGIDECIAKPIGPQLTWAKIQAWLRRAWTMPAEAMTLREAAGLRLEPEKRRLRLPDGREVGLTNLELRLLYLLMTHPGQLLEASMIIDRVWGFEGAEPGALKALVYRVRHKIEPDPAHPYFVRTAAGGYLFRKG